MSHYTLKVLLTVFVIFINSVMFTYSSFLIKYDHCRLREEKFIKCVLHNATAT